jgi:hypothetical protein
MRNKIGEYRTRRLVLKAWGKGEENMEFSIISRYPRLLFHFNIFWKEEKAEEENG